MHIEKHRRHRANKQTQKHKQTPPKKEKQTTNQTSHVKQYQINTICVRTPVISQQAIMPQ